MIYKKKKRKKQKKQKKLSYIKLKKKAWRAWSRYRRKKFADSSGYTECITCGKTLPWQLMDAGHFVHNKLDFKEENINPQCTRCNRFLHGNLGVYAVWLDNWYGKGTAERLIKMGQRVVEKYTHEELLNIIKLYE